MRINSLYQKFHKPAKTKNAQKNNQNLHKTITIKLKKGIQKLKITKKSLKI